VCTNSRMNLDVRINRLSKLFEIPVLVCYFAMYDTGNQKVEQKLYRTTIASFLCLLDHSKTIKTEEKR
jgi:hypothetical protein